MGATLSDLLAGWRGHGVVIRHDAQTDTWCFIALHDLRLGPAVGGCRMQVYDTPAAGLEDALRLAEGMTYKWAAIDVRFGGGKSVLAVPRPLAGAERNGLLQRFAGLIESLRGTFLTGVDMGTSPADIRLIAATTRHVMGVVDGHSIDPGPYTARGVYCGLRAAVEHVFGAGDLSGRRVLIQGTGDVGAPLARQLAEAGAELTLVDVDAARASALALELGAEQAPVDRALDIDCDVFAPCAVGAVLDHLTIPRLRCRIVAGSANNQLARAEDAERLQRRGIVYAPDYIINAGGAIAFAMLQQGDAEVAILRRIEAIGTTLQAILDEADQSGTNPAVAARRRADAALARAT